MTTKTTGKVYRKLAVRAGVYRQMSVDPYTDQMVTETVYISPQYLKQSAWSTMQMMRRGIDVPVCLDHQESAVPRKSVDKWSEDEMRSSVGLLQSVSYNPETESHEYVFEIKDPAIAEKIDNGTIKRVSPNFLSQIGSGDGGNWQNIVGHLALTFRPKDYRQSPEKMEPVAYSAKTGQKRFSVLAPVKNSGILIVPMHKLEMGVLKTMVRKRGNEWRFSSTDYTFRFSSKDAFENWLKHHYSKTLRMSVNRKPFATLYFAVVHAPVGGININGRMYKGGQFIPAANLEGIPEADRQKIQEASAKRLENRNQSAAKWKNDGEDWHQAIARHAGEHGSRPMDEDDERAASRRLNSLKAHHGENVHQRIAELAGTEAKQLAQLQPGDPKADHIKRRLRAYAKMSEALKASNGSEAVPEFNPQPPPAPVSTIDAMASEWKKEIPAGDHHVADDLVKEAKEKGWTPINFVDAMYEQGIYKPKDTAKAIDDVYFKHEKERSKKPEAPKITTSSYDGKTQHIMKNGEDEIGEISTIEKPDGNHEVSNVLVWPKHQRKGHAIELYKHAQEQAEKEGKKLFISQDRTEDAKALHSKMENLGMLKDGEVVGKNAKPDDPKADSESHANALADMAGAADDVDFAVKSRLHKEMKTELLSRMSDDYKHLTEEQKAAVDKEIGALPHTALGERDENGNFDDTGRHTSDEAGKIIDKVNDMAIEVKDVNERKERDEKKKSQHAKDVEEAAKRGMVFERPDNHDNPGELKVNPEQLDKAKAAAQEYRDKAKQHLAETKNQMNKQLVSRGKRLHKQYSGVADDIEAQVAKHEKEKAPLEVTPSMVQPSNKPLPKQGDDSGISGDPVGVAKKVMEHYLKNYETGVHSDRPLGAVRAISDMSDEDKKKFVSHLVSAGMIGKPWEKRKNIQASEVLNDLYLNVKNAENMHNSSQGTFKERTDKKDQPWYKKAKSLMSDSAPAQAKEALGELSGKQTMQTEPQDSWIKQTKKGKAFAPLSDEQVKSLSDEQRERYVSDHNKAMNAPWQAKPFSVIHAPAGGADVQGKHYLGGQFTPMEREEQKAFMGEMKQQMEGKYGQGYLDKLSGVAGYHPEHGLHIANKPGGVMVMRHIGGTYKPNQVIHTQNGPVIIESAGGAYSGATLGEKIRRHANKLIDATAASPEKDRVDVKVRLPRPEDAKIVNASVHAKKALESYQDALKATTREEKLAHKESHAKHLANMVGGASNTFSVIHAPVGGSDVGGTHYLGGQFVPSESGKSAIHADAPKEQEKKQFHVKADAHARNLKLKPKSVEIAGQGKVNGVAHGDLAIHPVGGKWNITHIPTGKRVGQDDGKNGAIKKAYLLHHGLDWSKPGPQHQARLRDVNRGEVPRDLQAHELTAHGDLPNHHYETTPDAAKAFMEHEPNYMKARQKYIDKQATKDEKGDIKSVPINVDEWREYIPGYRGTNAHVVHEASSKANKKFFAEMLEKQKGKGNNTAVILAGGGGCHGINTPIMMADGTVKMVQDVMEGDYLMGPDSAPREVLKLIRGGSMLYNIIPTKGMEFTVNGDHVMSLMTITRNKVKAKRKDVRVELTVKQILERGKRFFDNFFLHRAPVDFEWNAVPVDPYFLGLWLGDGDKTAASITNADEEIRQYLKSFVKRFPKLKLSIMEKPDNKASRYSLALKSQTPAKGTRSYPKNHLIELMRWIGVIDSKHIPSEYLFNDRDVRLSVLAGLLDSDGSYQSGCFDFVTKYKHLADQVERLARSLGFSAYAKACVKASQTGKKGTYYRMCISGEVDQIPTKILRKQAGKRATHYADGKRTRNVLHTGFKIESIGLGNFYGFTLSGDGLYLLGDFTVTHNSGKGTAVGKHLDEAQYPIRIDQTSSHYDSLVSQFDQIRKAGMLPEMVFIDRQPSEAWKNGVVSRAMYSAKSGELPRTVPYHVALQANIDARKVALRVAQEHPDVKLRVIDNHEVGNSKMIDDPSEIVRHLYKQDYNMDEEMKGAKEHVDELERVGSIPAHIAKGLRGE